MTAVTPDKNATASKPGPAPGTRRGTRMPRAQREAQILRLAEEIFGQHGYQATTMEMVAEAAGITKPVVYDLFGSKDGLLAAVIVQGRTQLQEALKERWRSLDETAPTVDFYRTGIRTFFEFIDEHSTTWSLLQQESAFGHTSSEQVEEFRTIHAQNIVETLTKAGRAPDVPPQVLEGVIEGLVGALERVAVWRTTHPEVTAEQATELLMALTWRGLESALETRRGA